jgi:hypothetical protein
MLEGCEVQKTIPLLEVFVFGLLVALLFGFQTVRAQYTEDGQPFVLVSSINIASPSNSTYTPQPLTLNITFKSFLDSSKANITIIYSIDGKINSTLETRSTLIPMGIQSYYVINGSATLPELPEGSHSITVLGRYEFPMVYHNIAYDNRTVYLTVNDGNPPTISDLSIENRTYSQGNLPFNFTVDGSTSWMGYCLDGQANVTVTENSTLTELPSGSHTLTVYANDTVGNMGVSSTVNFSIAEPFPTTIVIGSVISVAVVGLGLLAYSNKNRRNKSP